MVRILLLIGLLVSLMGCTMVSEEPVFEVNVAKEGDVVETAVTPGILTLNIISDSGIGNADVQLINGEWPEKIVFRVHTKGLGNFAMSYGETAVSASVSSSGMVLNSVIQDGQDTPVSEDSDFYMPVSVEDSYFEVEAPADFFMGDYDEFAISWIDFYR